MLLSQKEIADSLGLPLVTVERWRQQGKIPIRKKGDLYKFDLSVMKRWAQIHNLTFDLKKDNINNNDHEKNESLIKAITEGGIFYDIDANNLETALKQIVDQITFLEKNEKRKLYRQLIKREQLSSTGIGSGIAFPHPYDYLSDILKKSTITTFFLKNPINYNAFDGKPVFVMFLLLCTSVKSYLNFLLKLTPIIHNNELLNFLNQKPDENSFYKKIIELEHSNLD